MNKKILSIVLVLFQLLSITACVNSSDSGATAAKSLKTTTNIKNEYVFYIKDGKTYLYDDVKKSSELLVDTVIDIAEDLYGIKVIKYRIIN